MMIEKSFAKVNHFDSKSIQMEHQGFSARHVRNIDINAESVTICDQYQGDERLSIQFILAPAVNVDIKKERVILSQGEKVMQLTSQPEGRWSLENCLYSTAYGFAEKTCKVVLNLEQQDPVSQWQVYIQLKGDGNK